MTLFEIDKAITEFEFEIDEETGEILNAEELDNLKLAREEKIEGVSLWVKNLKAEAEAVKQEKNAMADREKRLERKIEGLKSYLAYALNGEQFSTPRVALSWRKSKRVEIQYDDYIPEEYINVKVTKTPDKTAIKKAIEGGEEIKGVSLVESNNLQIK